MRFFIYFFIPKLTSSCCFFIQTKDSRLVLLVHSFPPKNLLWTLIPFKLLFDANMAKFSRIDVTIGDIFFNDTSIKSQMLHPNGIPSVAQREKSFVLISTLIWARCFVGDFVANLTTRTCTIQFSCFPLQSNVKFILHVLKFMILHSCKISRNFQ
jgi:hypothetical protein